MSARWRFFEKISKSLFYQHYNVLASRNERMQQYPLSDRVDASLDKCQIVTHQNTDYLKLSFQVQNTCNSWNVNKRYICRGIRTSEIAYTYKGYIHMQIIKRV